MYLLKKLMDKQQNKQMESSGIRHTLTIDDTGKLTHSVDDAKDI